MRENNFYSDRREVATFTLNCIYWNYILLVQTENFDRISSTSLSFLQNRLGPIFFSLHSYAAKLANFSWLPLVPIFCHLSRRPTRVPFVLIFYANVPIFRGKAFWNLWWHKKKVENLKNVWLKKKTGLPTCFQFFKKLYPFFLNPATVHYLFLSHRLFGKRYLVNLLAYFRFNCITILY